jgi:ferredoxin
VADIILSPVEGGDLVAAGTEHGAEILARAAADCTPASEDQLVEQAERRSAQEERVRASLRRQGLDVPENIADALQRQWTSPVWDKISATCVECGACNFVCPSCHCFFLRDYASKEGEPGRTRVWDACLSENFSRVAGGANPNQRRQARVRHRLERKFIAPYEADEGYACTGCGRCIDACLGHLDIRAILQELAHAPESVPADHD